MWKVIGASAAGTSHQAAGRQCEDACGWRAAAGVTCLAVADGAGSRPESRCGATLAVESSLRACAEGPRSGDPAAWLRLIFAAAREQITARARADGNDADDYATTLAVAILKGPSVAGRLRVTSVRLGTGLFATDRGVRQLPAWLFGFAGVPDPAAVQATARPAATASASAV